MLIQSLDEFDCFSLQKYCDDVNKTRVFNLLINDLMRACMRLCGCDQVYLLIMVCVYRQSNVYVYV